MSESIAQHFVPDVLLGKEQEEAKSKDAPSQASKSDGRPVVFSILGQEATHVSTFLFQCALSLAQSTEGKVVYICSKEGISKHMPMSFAYKQMAPGGSTLQRVSRRPDAMERIQMKYVECFEDLELYLMNAHNATAAISPKDIDAIFVDDFVHICSQRASSITNSRDLRAQIAALTLLINLGQACGKSGSTVIGTSTTTKISHLKTWLTASFVVRKVDHTYALLEDISSADENFNWQSYKGDALEQVFRYEIVTAEDEDCVFPFE